MKRKQSFLLGNCLMVTGMAIMVISIAYNICNHVFQLNPPEYLAEISLISLFIGALIWLAGARVSGHEGIADRYWWLRNFDERHLR